jgi:hypothetical protein
VEWQNEQVLIIQIFITLKCLIQNMEKKYDVYGWLEEILFNDSIKLRVPETSDLPCKKTREIHDKLEQILREDIGNWAWSIRFLDERFKGADSPVHELATTLLPEGHKDSPVILLFRHYRKLILDICTKEHILNMHPDDVDNLVEYLDRIAHEEQGGLGKKTLNQVQLMYQGNERRDGLMQNRITSSRSLLPQYLWDCPIKTLLKNIDELSVFSA